MFSVQIFFTTIVEDWLRMFVNTLHFFLWLFLWLKDLLYITFVILPPRLAVGFYQWLLLRLPPVVKVCYENGWCELNDVGKSIPMILAMLGIVWWLKQQNKKSKIKS